jgi:hypothetical protein
LKNSEFFFEGLFAGEKLDAELQKRRIESVEGFFGRDTKAAVLTDAGKFNWFCAKTTLRK